MREETYSRRHAALLLGGAAAVAALPSAASAAGDPFEDLAADHRRVSALATRMQASRADATRDRIALLKEVKQEFARHAAVEEYLIYPALRQLPEFERPAQELAAAHHEVKTLLYELELMPRSDSRWGDKAGALRELLLAHYRREAEILPRYRAGLNPTQLEFLGQMAERERRDA